MFNQNQQENQWIDISQPLSKDIAHWPGDTPFSYEVAYPKEETGSVNIGQITTSTHIGTHIDAPFHFKNDGQRVLDIDLNIYIGASRLIDIGDAKEMNREVLSQFNLDGIARLLIRTSIKNNPTVFPKDIPYVTRDGAEFLKEQGIKLIGVNVPSVDPLDSKDLEGHHALYENGIYILLNFRRLK
ncbi:arylformamidase [Evansella vedderi]|uniref:Arylformamidase n=1 Tax=Evansella vedderi TaxID=38282 RepID=A0ABT9ZV25_9BACI|nr:arylformamidase [Evansella vedderi]MDQ0255097.1 arylformamidase [Evansella vedderi]